MRPLELTAAEVENLRVLYLAKRAPRDIANPPLFHPEDGVVSVYHFELAEIFADIGLTFHSSDNLEDLLKILDKYNYVFSVFNRGPFKGSEVFVSSVCEYFKVAYLGADPHVRALAEDKHLAKLLASHVRIPTPPWMVVRCNTHDSTVPDFTGPYFVKPRCGASSEFITELSIHDTWSAALKKVRELTHRGLDAIVEKFVAGIDVTLPVLGQSRPWFLPCCETRSSTSGGVVTYRQKRLLDPGITRSVFDDHKIIGKLRDEGVKFYRHLEPIDYFRLDFRLNESTGEYYFLEVNVCCNLGSHSIIAIPARSIGLSQRALVEHILAYSVRRQNTLR